MSLFQEFFLALTKCLFWQVGWALGFFSMKSRHYPDIPQFPKILRLKSFSNLNIPCV